MQLVQNSQKQVRQNRSRIIKPQSMANNLKQIMENKKTKFNYLLFHCDQIRFKQNYFLQSQPHNMSNLANYSPYNKTYKFLLFQNQAYHQKNKRTARPCVRTNLRYDNTPIYSGINPQINESFLGNSNGMQKPATSSTGRGESQQQSMTNSMFFSSNKSMRASSPEIDKSKRIIHKNQSFDKFRNKKIEMENRKLVSRLIFTDCQVIHNKKSARSFDKHLKYRQIKNKYNSQGKRKHCLVMGNKRLLCPTLKGYNQSGLGSKFLQLDLSMVSNNKSSSIPMGKRNIKNDIKN